MKLYTPEQLSERCGSKYQGCVVSAKYARKLHNQYRDSTQFLDKKFTTESLQKLCEEDLNFEIVDRRLSKKKPKSIFPDKG